MATNDNVRSPHEILADFRESQQPDHQTDLGSTTGVSPPAIRIHLFRGLKTDTVGRVRPFASRPEARKHITEAGPFPSKEACPMFSAGIFDGPIAGRAPVEFTLVVGEHDAGTVTVEEAIARLQEAGVAAFLYTSASHAPASPRWRVVALLRAPCGAEAYRAHLDLLNGALDGALAVESADLNRRWFYGQVAGAAEYRHAVTKGGKLLDDLARTDHGITPIAVRSPKPPKASAPPAEREPATERDIDRAISALQAIPNSGEVRRPYEGWRDVAMALHAATGGAQRALDALIEWTADGQDEKTTAIWNGFRVKPDGIGPGTLFHAALAAGWVDPDRAPDASGFEPIDVFGAAPVDVEAEVNRLIGVFLVDGDWDEADLALLSRADVAVRVAEISEQAAEAARRAIEKAKQGQVVPADASTATVLDTARGISTIVRAMRAPGALGCRLMHDDFTATEMIDTGQGPRPITDNDKTRIRCRLEALGFKAPGIEDVRAAVSLVAEENRIDSARVWLESLPAWDGQDRLSRFCADYLGTEDSPYAAAVGRYLWSALAGRVMSPGCQADMAPVLVGRQGAGKTQAVKAIVPDYTEQYAEINLGTRDADLSRLLRGKLVGELAELRGLATRDAESIKAFLTATGEEWTPKFKEHNTSFRRRLVFIGTTNQDQFLADLTGNRRWLPIRVDTCDVEAIRRDRDQLWAQGLAIFREQGIEFREAEELAAGQHEEFEEVGTLEEALANRYLFEDSAERRARQTIARHTRIEVLAQVTGRQALDIPLTTQRAFRPTIERLWRRAGAKEVRGVGLCITVEGIAVKVYASGGKNCGFLLPPERGVDGGKPQPDAGGLL